MGLIPLGILSSAGSQRFGTYELIETKILTANTFSIVFSNINTYSSLYKHLQLRVVARSVRADVGDDIRIQFNSDTSSSNYYYHSLYGTGSVAGSESNGTFNGAKFMQATSTNFTANAFNAGVCDITDAFAAKNKTLRTFSGVPGSYDRVWLGSNLWNNTATINSMTLITGSGANFLSGSRFSLYGIRG